MLATKAQYLAKMCCPRAWGHSGDLTANLAPGVGHLHSICQKAPVYPHPPQEGKEGHKIDKCITRVMAYCDRPLNG